MIIYVKGGMKNIQNIIDRYKDEVGYYRTVTGFLMYGGKQYYRINSVKRLNLNSNGSAEFITNKKGQVQEYSILSKSSYSMSGSTKRWGSRVSSYYLWPWFPNKRIVGFQAVRIMPGLLVGSFVSLEDMSLEKGLEYPEFFRPVYADKKLNK